MFLLDGLKLETGRSRKKIKLHFAKACKSYSSILKHAVLGAKVVKLFVCCSLRAEPCRFKAEGEGVDTRVCPGVWSQYFMHSDGLKAFPTETRCIFSVKHLEPKS